MSRKLSLTRLAVLALGLLLSALPLAAEDSRYLFDLSEERILDLMDRYRGKGNYDRAEALAAMVEPFDCRRFADLCADIGEQYGYYLLERVWSQAQREVPGDLIFADAAATYEGLTARYLELAFPDGLDPRDPYLGVDGEDTEPCTENVTFAEQGSFRLRQAARAIYVVLGNFQDATTTFFKKNLSGKYKTERAEFIEVKADFFITGPLAPAVVPRTKAHANDKRVVVSFAATFDFTHPHTEACGTVSDDVFLTTCACTGPRPAIYQRL